MTLDIVWESVSKPGSANFFISKDGKYFAKQDNKFPDRIEKEYRKLLRLHDASFVDSIKFLQPVEFIASRNMMITRYVHAKNLTEELEPSVHYEFGRILKNLHDRKVTHGDLQINDVLYSDGVYTLTDIANINEKKKELDLYKMMLSYGVFAIWQIWKYPRYMKCRREFLLGYVPEDERALFAEYGSYVVSKTDENMEKGDMKSWVKGSIRRVAFRVGLI